ncbi:probable inactive heme oxygenase 2, chloroplastic [Macadamia integrifolia]|uniref:probable inactive heme oxygenase 2, chloroplastic n=1 Tax=Macadamia integrifolia TaxID=60698 RepID=UPI001C4EC44D|nr:probable inactive heme oxygenase 2, chloroplastic [Macadamia integrifolia]
MFSSPAAAAAAAQTTSPFRMPLQPLVGKPSVRGRLHFSLGHEVGLQLPTKFNTAKFHSQSQSQSRFQFQRSKNNGLFIFCCSNSDNSSANGTAPTSTAVVPSPPPVIKKRKRYRKLYPGENEGIVEEMRFVAMRLRNNKGKPISTEEEEEEDSNKESEETEEDDVKDTWQPSMEGFLKYLVDSKLVFDTLDHVVEASDDVAYAYFRKTGLERSECLLKDLEWFAQQNIVIPEPSPPGVSYAKYLRELAEKSAPLFLCHFYNIYFAHIAGGQVIAKQVSEKLLEGRELEFFKWDGDVQEMLKDVRETLNKLGEHWIRDEKNRCLREAKKSFQFLGHIIRLIIL